MTQSRCVLCSQSIRKASTIVRECRARFAQNHRETQNGRHFWTRLRSSRLKSVDSHRDRGESWSRNAELWSLLDLPLERIEERREEAGGKREEKREQRGENIEERREDDPGPKCGMCGVFFVFAMYVSCVCIRLRASYQVIIPCVGSSCYRGNTGYHIPSLLVEIWKYPPPESVTVTVPSPPILCRIFIF